MVDQRIINRQKKTAFAKKNAKVIKIGDRYFSELKQPGEIIESGSIAGAHIFAFWEEETLHFFVKKIEKELNEKVEVKIIGEK